MWSPRGLCGWAAACSRWQHPASDPGPQQLKYKDKCSTLSRSELAVRPLWCELICRECLQRI